MGRCVYICMNVNSSCVCMYIHIYACQFKLCVYVYTYVCMSIQVVCVCMYVCMYNWRRRVSNGKSRVFLKSPLHSDLICKIY